jgi:hypothetical protein
VRGDTEQLPGIVGDESGERTLFGRRQEVVESIDKWFVGVAEARGVEAEEDHRVLGVEGPSHLGGDAALSRSRLTAEEDRLSLAFLYQLPHRLQPLELLTASSQAGMPGLGETAR